MATTTNYGWETPDDTDLVKDGASAIRTLGSSVDTTTKALNPETTLGDVAYRSSTANTNTRLAIGSNGQVLTVASGVPSWAAPASEAGYGAFQAYRATTNQSVTASTWTKVALNAEDYDVNNLFDSTTNNRYTPNKAGKYVFGYASNNNATTVAFAVYKNGTLAKYFPMGAGSVTLDMNGTTDYAEFYVFLTGTSLVLYSGTDSNTAYGFFIRS